MKESIARRSEIDVFLSPNEVLAPSTALKSFHFGRVEITVPVDDADTAAPPGAIADTVLITFYADKEIPFAQERFLLVH